MYFMSAILPKRAPTYVLLLLASDMLSTESAGLPSQPKPVSNAVINIVSFVDSVINAGDDEGTSSIQAPAATSLSNVGITSQLINEFQPPITQTQAPQAYSIQGQPAALISNSAPLVGSQAVAIGGPPITLGSGTSQAIVRLATDTAGRTVIVVDSSSSLLQPIAPATIAPINPIITIADLYATPLPNNQLLINSQTLAANHPIALGTETSTIIISLATNSAGSSLLIISTSTTTITPLIPITSAPTPRPHHIDGLTTVVSSGSTQITEYIIDSHALSAGHPITMSAGPDTTVCRLVRIVLGIRVGS